MQLAHEDEELTRFGFAGKKYERRNSLSSDDSADEAGWASGVSVIVSSSCLTVLLEI